MLPATTDTSSASSASSSLYQTSETDSDNAYRRVEKMYRKHHVSNKHGKMVGRFF